MSSHPCFGDVLNGIGKIFDKCFERLQKCTGEHFEKQQINFQGKINIFLNIRLQNLIFG